jgi:DNA uptake protein ComE-like DNA-binding protein
MAGRPEQPQPAPVLSPEEVLNSATRQQLLSVYGIGPVLADRIIQNRPYTAVHDVVKQGIIPESIFVQLRKQLLDRRGA